MLVTTHIHAKTLFSWYNFLFTPIEFSGSLVNAKFIYLVKRNTFNTIRSIKLIGQYFLLTRNYISPNVCYFRAFPVRNVLHENHRSTHNYSDGSPLERFQQAKMYEFLNYAFSSLYVSEHGLCNSNDISDNKTTDNRAKQ